MLGTVEVKTLVVSAFLPFSAEHLAVVGDDPYNTVHPVVFIGRGSGFVSVYFCGDASYSSIRIVTVNNGSKVIGVL